MFIVMPGQEALQGYIFDFLEGESMLCVLIRMALEAILISTHNIPFPI